MLLLKQKLPYFCDIRVVVSELLFCFISRRLFRNRWLSHDKTWRPFFEVEDVRAEVEPHLQRAQLFESRELVDSMRVSALRFCYIAAGWRVECFG